MIFGLWGTLVRRFQMRDLLLGSPFWSLLVSHPQCRPDRLEELVSTMSVGHDQVRLALPWVAARTIRVDTERVGIVDFDLKQADQRMLNDNGRAAATDFLAGWNWEDYQKKYRQ